MVERSVDGVAAGFEDLELERLRRRPGVKWARARGAIAAWVADMDFPPCPPVAARLREVLDIGDLGYPDWQLGTPLRAAFVRRMAQRYEWQPDPSAVREIGDLIQGVQMVLHLATRSGDAVAMHVPNYPPFLTTIASMGRRLVPLPLVRRSATSGGPGWGFDAAAMADAVAVAGARVLILVNPHNPTGRVFSRPELEAVAATARRHDLLVLADEIHADLVYAPHRHIPFASLSADTAARTVTLTSASKAFNLAGLRCGLMHVGSHDLLRVRDGQPSDLFGRPNLFGVEAALAAWTPEGDAWLDALLTHLDGNRRRIVDAVGAWPGTDLAIPEGTYLAWLDVRSARLGAQPARVFESAGVRLSPGEDFGPGGAGFVRLNFATSAAVLDEVLMRMGTALSTGSGLPSTELT